MRSITRPVSLAGCLAAALLLFAAAGCGVDRPQTIPVRGRISFDGDSMPGPGMIYFTTIEAAEGFPSRPGTAEFGTDGRFSVQTFVPGDGLMPGRYLAQVYCWEVAPGMGQPHGKSYLPPQYGDVEGVGWEIDVQPDQGSITLEWDIAPGP